MRVPRARPFAATRLTTAWLATSFFALAGCTTELDPHATLKATYFPATVRGNFESSGSTSPATRVDVQDDLDLNSEDQVEAEVGLDLAGAHVAFAWMPLHFDGKEQLDHDEQIGETRFAAGANVESELELPTWRLAVDAPVLRSDSGEVRAGLGAYWWNFTMEVKDVGSGAREQTRVTEVMPVIVASGFVDAGHEFSAGVTTAFGALDFDRHLIDVAGVLRRTLGHEFTASVGWRWIRYAMDESGDSGTLDVFGPTFSMEWRF